MSEGTDPRTVIADAINGRLGFPATRGGTESRNGVSAQGTITASQYRLTVTEKEMEAVIRDAVGTRGRVFHIRDSRGLPDWEGFPDLVIILPERNRVLFVELKSQKRKVTMGQAAVMIELEQCHEIEAYIVRPKPKTGEIGFEQLMEVLSS